MAEGERIWYWRNRTENERWFWEIAFWDKLAFRKFESPLIYTPIFPFEVNIIAIFHYAALICTVAYEYLVPNHFIWAVIVPATLIFIQSGSLPSPKGLEFWAIAYFGFYLKCWPDFAAMLGSVATILFGG